MPVNIEENIKIELLLQLKWDTQDGIPKIVTHPAITSILNSNKTESGFLTAPYRFRISKNGHYLAILQNDPSYLREKPQLITFLIYNTEIKSIQKTICKIEPNNFMKIELSDFSITDKGEIVLLYYGRTPEKKLVNSFMLIKPDGTVAWKTEWNDEELENPGKCVRIAGNSNNLLFIQCEKEGQTRILKAQTTNGQVENHVNIGYTDINVFIDGKGHVFYTCFILGKNNRAYVKHNVQNGQDLFEYAGPAVYACLGYPKLITGSELYCAQTFSMYSLSDHLNINWHIGTNNIVITVDSVFLCQFEETSKNLLVHKYDNRGIWAETITIDLDLPGIRLARLLGITSTGNFVIETYQGGSKKYMQSSPRGKDLMAFTENETVPTFRLQAASTWEIDPGGNIILPVAGDNALYFIKVNIPQNIGAPAPRTLKNEC